MSARRVTLQDWRRAGLLHHVRKLMGEERAMAGELPLAEDDVPTDRAGERAHRARRGARVHAGMDAHRESSPKRGSKKARADRPSGSPCERST